MGAFGFQFFPEDYNEIYSSKKNGEEIFSTDRFYCRRITTFSCEEYDRLRYKKRERIYRLFELSAESKESIIVRVSVNNGSPNWIQKKLEKIEVRKDGTHFIFDGQDLKFSNICSVAVKNP